MCIRLVRRAVALLVISSSGFLSIASCSGASSDGLSSGGTGGGKTAGTEGGACLATGTGCNTGLECVGDVCVRASTPTTDAGTGINDSGGGGTDGGGSCAARPSTGDICAAGDCRCSSLSKCLAASEAVKCCNDQPVACKTADGDSPDGGQCTFKHPLLDAGARYCGPGDCYCKKRDSCYAAQVALGCCPSSDLTCY